MNINFAKLAFLLLSSLLFACGGGSDGDNSSDPVVVTPPPAPTPPPPAPTPPPPAPTPPPPAPTPPPPAPTPPPVTTDQLTKLNQLGYFTSATKIAIVPQVDATEFEIRDTSNNEVMHSGSLSSSMTWDLADDKQFKQADFSSFTREGNYQLIVAGVADSVDFTIANDVYDGAHDAALKAYYFNRASTALDTQFAGVFQRPLGHADTDVEIHSTAASAARPAGSKFPAPKGWYDAGDYGKYIVNSGISTYTLLAAFEHYPNFYSQRNINIPESSNSTPDILDEIMWNLEWMLAMQDPNDGGVYHKLTTLNFSGEQMPHQANAQRYFAQKSTAATLDFAAVMAAASRIFADFNVDYPGKSSEFRQAAVSAWQWAESNSNVIFRNSGGIVTGEYGDGNVNDEFAWAAAELYLLTNNRSYLDEFFARNVSSGVASWPNVSALAYISLLNNGSSVLTTSEYQMIENSIVGTANEILSSYNNSPYKVPMRSADFNWGSNSNALNRAWIVLEAYKRTKNADFLAAAHGVVDYVLGRNPTDYSFVTGFGDKTPIDIHHRQSRADTIAEPIPGFIVGGPHSGQQDNCNYPSNRPALSYVDEWCSYSTNEVTINWNAPFIYVVAALKNL